MEPKFTYDDIVFIKDTANLSLQQKIGKIAWIVGVFEKRPSGDYFKQFPEGIIYSIEFEDGSSIEVHENAIELLNKN